MKDNINLLFLNNIAMIGIIDKIVLSFRSQNYDKALRDSSLIIDQLSNNMELINKVTDAERINILLKYLSDIMQAQSKKDYVLLADLYELQLLKYFIELQEDIIYSGSIELSDVFYKNNMEMIIQRNPELGEQLSPKLELEELQKQGYEIEFSSCGLATLAITDEKGKYYIHSNSRIYAAESSLANAWYREGVVHYIIYGLGLGYHIKELLEIDNSIFVEVYESDINVIKLATAYTDMNTLVQSGTRIIYDPDFTKLFRQIQNINDDAKFFIHYPSLRNIKDTAIREKLENYFLQYSSVENQRKLLNGNFRENIHHYDALVDELKDNFQGKDIYIVAAGPSLDKNFRQLKNADRTKVIILATGTVFRKLLNAGITPDYVIVTDANSRVYHQIAGYEDSSVPMLYLSSAYKGFAQNYKGRKYMICQQDYDKAEEFAREKKVMLFQTGGSVSTTALDIGISFECKRIIFLGLDLAFTDNYVHASETSRRDLASIEDLRQVTDIYGNKIYTSKSLDIYRQWMENRIRDVKGIEFINATEGGARIEGMKIMTLSECL